MKKKINLFLSKIRNKKILIQGLGLNGGGVGAALFFLKNDFTVTVTDLKTKEELAKSIAKLAPYEDRITYVLGEHRDEDFINADIVLKGPGVAPDNHYIKVAKTHGANITSDIEIFLKIAPCPVYAVTGSKGKSTVVSVIYNIFQQKTEDSYMGGNITISPLTFIDDLKKTSLVILELSSWQLRDLKGKNIHLKGVVITNLLKDHQNYYTNMEDYLKDKKIICTNQNKDDFCILPYKDLILNRDRIKTNSKFYYFSWNDTHANFFFHEDWAYYKNHNLTLKLFTEDCIKMPGDHIKLNMLIAAGFCQLIGVEKKYIVKGITSYKGERFRLFLSRVWNDIKFYNDSTATIPEAAVRAIKAFKEPIIWIAGGNDKNSNFSVLHEIKNIPKSIYLLTGNGTDRLKEHIDRDDIIESDSLEELFKKAVSDAESGDIILLSPGCTSFGHFQNEFQRGELFDTLVWSL